ncbi:DUF202 domain-containing protein [Nocardia salmonicida]|uniref:DUF202 domain-containing protein n=1 Tax=Nocardia salmonicida TaxID=53431 RepID=UPI0007A4CD60|nr:DUF202 domain-containing protein [Nocardia salmonicida]
MTGIGGSDAGLAVERTALAWRRTAASAWVVSALLGHHVLTSRQVTLAHDESVLRQLSSALVPLGAAAMLLGVSVLGWRRNRALRGGDRRAVGTSVALVSVAVVVVAVIMLLSAPFAGATTRPSDRTVGLLGQSARGHPLGGWEAEIWREHATPNRQGKLGGPESSR